MSEIATERAPVHRECTTPACEDVSVIVADQAAYASQLAEALDSLGCPAWVTFSPIRNAVVLTMTLHTAAELLARLTASTLPTKD